MKKNKCIRSVLCTLAFASINVCQAASQYTNFTDEIACGKVKITIKSSCQKSDDEMSLNTCKPQNLKIGRDNGSRSVALPELNQDDINSIKKEDGSIADLFVIKMGCAQVAGANYAILYYSIGGGSEPYSELWTAYDESGSLLASKNFPLQGNALEAVNKKMKKVHSIMPE